jgi:dTDP-glucose 4,6-dehydratase
MKRILVTGGCGFIGSAFVRKALASQRVELCNLDKLTYAATLESTAAVASDPRYMLQQVDITDQPAVATSIEAFRPDCIVHFAAESHVDRSIDQPSTFILTNVLGSFTLAEAALRYWKKLDESAKRDFRLVHVSTDEVFGSLTPDAPQFDEDSPYSPNSPYAASKAGADHIMRAWQRTYGLPVIVTNLSNNYGPFQFPEKLIPVVIAAALEGRPIPIYGDGRQVRDWLHVEDSVTGLMTAAEKGVPGRTYLFSGAAETANLDLVRRLCELMDKHCPTSPHRPHERLITMAPDRPGHDRRYGLSAACTMAGLGWRPQVSLDDGLERTVRWYLENRDWWQALRRRYDGRRLGLGHV